MGSASSNNTRAVLTIATINYLGTGGFKGGGKGSCQDARGDEVALSTKDFSVQFYTKCAVTFFVVLSYRFTSLQSTSI